MNGKKHGYGEFTKQSGDRYTGQWENDKIHGKGIKYHADGNFMNIFDPLHMMHSPQAYATSTLKLF